MSSAFWKQVELVDKPKQLLFLDRVLFHFSVRKKQVRHISSARMSPEQWDQCLEVCCLLGYTLQQMTVATGKALPLQALSVGNLTIITIQSYNLNLNKRKLQVRTARDCSLSPLRSRRPEDDASRGRLAAMALVCAWAEPKYTMLGPRDYMAECEPLVNAKLDVKITDLAIWLDHAPNHSNASNEAATGAMIQQLDMDSINKSYEADLLKLASDMS